MKDNKDFYNWYKTKITNNAQDPPEDAWQNISDELDTNDVWHRIAVELDTPRGWSASKAIYYSLPVLLLFLFSGGAYYYYFNKLGRTAPVTEQIAVAGDQISTTPRKESVTEIPARSSFDIRSETSAERSTDKKEPRRLPEESKRLSPTGDVTLSETEGDSNPEKAGHATAIESTQKEVSVREKNISVNPRSAEQEEKTIAVLEDDDREVGDAIGQPRNRNHDSFGTTTEFSRALAEEKESNRTEEVLRGEAVTQSRDTDPLKHRLASELHNPASTRSFVVADSMLAVAPVMVELHADSLQRITVTATPEKRRYDKTIAFGITASAKNTWLLNRTTLRGLEKRTLNTTLPDFGKDIGMVFCYNFSPILSTQVEGMLLSEVGQRYNEYENGKYVDREVDLRYYTMNVLLKYNRNNSVGGHSLNSSHGMIGGLYASRLNEATETVEGGTSDHHADYTKNNYGVILGYEYNRYLLPNLIFTSGLRVNYGFHNIDAGLFSKTMTGSFDLNIALKYRLLKDR